MISFKKYLALSTFCLFLIPFSPGQELPYQPFPVSDAFWTEFSGGYQCNCCAEYSNILAGDTLVNGQIYHMIRTHGAHYLTSPGGDCTHIFSYLIDYPNGAIREDTLARKLYYLPQGAQTDTLLYDFDLQLGDTLPETYTNSAFSGFKVVSAIDSIAIGTEYHRRFAISTEYAMDYVHLIEGIGSTFGLIAYLDPPFEFGTFLACFSRNGFTVYPDTLSECEIPTGTVALPEPEARVMIYPNPFNENANLLIPPSWIGATLEVYSLTGELTMKIQTNSASSGFRRGNLAAGTYMYRLIKEGISLTTGKFQIIN